VKVSVVCFSPFSSNGPDTFSWTKDEFYSQFVVKSLFGYVDTETEDWVKLSPDDLWARLEKGETISSTVLSAEDNKTPIDIFMFLTK